MTDFLYIVQDLGGNAPATVYRGIITAASAALADLALRRIYPALAAQIEKETEFTFDTSDFGKEGGLSVEIRPVADWIADRIASHRVIEEGQRILDTIVPGAHCIYRDEAGSPSMVVITNIAGHLVADGEDSHGISVQILEGPLTGAKLDQVPLSTLRVINPPTQGNYIVDSLANGKAGASPAPALK